MCRTVVVYVVQRRDEFMDVLLPSVSLHCSTCRPHAVQLVSSWRTPIWKQMSTCTLLFTPLFSREVACCVACSGLHLGDPFRCPHRDTPLSCCGALYASVGLSLLPLTSFLLTGIWVVSKVLPLQINIALSEKLMHVWRQIFRIDP